MTWVDIACLGIAAAFAAICGWTLFKFAKANELHQSVQVRAWQMKREMDAEVRSRVTKAVDEMKARLVASGGKVEPPPAEDVGIAEAPPAPRVYGPNEPGPVVQTGTIDDKHEMMREARRKMSDVHAAKRDELPGMMRDTAAVIEEG